MTHGIGSYPPPIQIPPAESRKRRTLAEELPPKKYSNTEEPQGFAFKPPAKPAAKPAPAQSAYAAFLNRFEELNVGDSDSEGESASEVTQFGNGFRV